MSKKIKAAAMAGIIALIAIFSAKYDVVGEIVERGTFLFEQPQK